MPWYCHQRLWIRLAFECVLEWHVPCVVVRAKCCLFCYLRSSAVRARQNSGGIHTVNAAPCFTHEARNKSGIAAGGMQTVERLSVPLMLCAMVPVPEFSFTQLPAATHPLVPWDKSHAQQKAPQSKRLRGLIYGSSSWARTSDPMINSHLLYQLSYRGSFTWGAYTNDVSWGGQPKMDSSCPNFLRQTFQVIGKLWI